MASRRSNPCAGKLPFEGSSPLSAFADSVLRASADASTRVSEAQNVRLGIGHLAKYLGRVPRVADLTTETLVGLSLHLIDRGRVRGTCDRYVSSLIRIARAALRAGVLASLPQIGRMRKQRRSERAASPLSANELNRLYGSARTMPGRIAGRPAALFWPALVLAMLDTGLSPSVFAKLESGAFDGATGTLRIGLLIYRLQPATSAAIAALAAAGPATTTRLFQFDAKGSQRFFSLFNHYRYLLLRAGLPRGRNDMLQRLVATAAEARDAVASIDTAAPFVPCNLPERKKGRRPRKRYAPPGGNSTRRFEAGPAVKEKSRAKERQLRDCTPHVYQIAASPDRAARTIRSFVETIYIPLRLQNSGSIQSLRGAVRRFCEFTCCDATLDGLSDDLVERWLSWCARAGYAPEGRKKFRATLLAVWRYAWRKRDPETKQPYIAELPRDIEPVRVPKPEPECWSVEEVSRLLNAAAAADGSVCGIPACLYWPALILTIYDTGLRIEAVMSLRVADVDLSSGWLKARHGTQKQKADQSLPIFRETAEAIRATDPQNRELLFPWPYKDVFVTLRRRLCVLLENAGLPSGPKDKFHKLRRTNGTYVADVAGEEAAMRQLGHSTVQVTRRYIDVRKLSRPARIVDAMRRPEWNFSAAADPAATAGDIPPLRPEGPK